MYLKSLVKVPNAPGKLLRQKKADTTYVYYEINLYPREKEYPTKTRRDRKTFKEGSRHDAA